jgi:hypothetical protein
MKRGKENEKLNEIIDILLLFFLNSNSIWKGPCYVADRLRDYATTPEREYG